jgi:dipeptidase
MASANIHSLAEELGLWKPGTRFVWSEVYGTAGQRGNSLREWAALNRLAPSLRLQATGDPTKDRYPFSVKPDQPVDVAGLTSIMRDHYQGTQFDVTEHPRFQVGGQKTPLARPFGSGGLFDLLGVEPERCIASETSGYVYISQVRDWLPNPIAGCMWFTHGPSYTGCFTPIYSGTTEIAESWSRSPAFDRIDRTQIQWKFQLIERLAGLEYQEAIQEVQGVFGPAEQRFLSLQAEFEQAATDVFNQHGTARAEEFVTRYVNTCLESVDDACDELVDYLMFRRLYGDSTVAPPKLPVVRPPAVSGRAGNGGS